MSKIGSVSNPFAVEFFYHKNEGLNRFRVFTFHLRTHRLSNRKPQPKTPLPFRLRTPPSKPQISGPHVFRDTMALQSEL